MSIFDLFKRKQREDYDEEYEEREEIKSSQQGKAPTAEPVRKREPVEKLLEDIWANREQYPDDMQAIELFLPALRDRLEIHETKCGAAEILASAGQEGAILDENGAPIGFKSENAKCAIYVPSNKMIAFVCVFPPIGDGLDISREMIMDALQENKVTYGIDQEKVDVIASEKKYGILFAIARGMTQTDGQDGHVKDCFSRQEDVGLKEDARGNVDHKSLRRFQGVLTGDLICEITPPTEGEDGIDVTGRILKAKAGQQPKIPQGKNTELSEDGTKLLATMDGDISFHNGVFNVDRLLTIEESVDNAVGNLDYNGNIVIQEDVKSGFKVCATGDIIVRGMVAGATLCAGGNIEIGKGMNGNGQGMLEARGDVKLTFMENANVICHHDVYASTIINSNVTCGGSVIVKQGKGIIIGGSIVAGKSVEAKRIGNQSGCENSIKIGQSMQDEDNLEYLRKELKENKDTLDKIWKNISYLKNKTELPINKKEILDKLQVQSILYVEKIDVISEKLEKLENTRPDFSQCRVRSDIIYPMTKISLDYAKFTVRDTTAMCQIYYEDGELVMGTF
ncbi:MAG: DUF342 domain-containing protein [Lachnospiraceae bacterium]|nr:DUF342 domain-containing protein [Lachnospiraceae bacterium]